MKVFKIYFVTVWIVLYLSASAFSQDQNLSHEEVITQIMDLSGLNVQIPQVADTIVNRADIKDFLSTLSQENREALEKEIAMAFDGNAMLAIVKDEIAQTLSDTEARALLKWYVTDDAKAMTAREETPKYKENWEEIYSTKKDPKPDARRLEIYQMMLFAMNFTEHATNEQTMLQRFLRSLILQDVKGYKIENDLKKEQKEIAKEVWETAMLSMSYDMASIDEKVLVKYLQFLASPAARSYQEGKSIGLIRAISFAGNKVLSKAEELIVKYPYPSLSDLHPKSKKLKRYKEGCENGDIQACSDLGYAYRKGIGVERDYFKALTPLKMSCEGGNARGCGVLGDMYWLALSVKRNDTKATEYFKRSCELGSTLGCGSLGVFYSKGYGVPKDQKKANMYFAKVCDAGDASGCRNLGNQYKHGYGVTKDHIKARELYEKACKGGNISSCWQAGRYYLNGQGVKQDYAKAIELYGISCKRRKVYACYELGNIYAEGAVVKKDIAKAKKYLKRACELGGQYACRAHKELDKIKEDKAN